MKRCPQCNRVETDEALKFCRVDGTTLVTGPLATGSETGTGQLGASPDASEVQTSILPHSTQANVDRPTGPTTALPEPVPANTRELAKPKRRKTFMVIAIVAAGVLGLALVVVVASTIVYFNFKKPAATAITSIAVMPFVNASGNAEVEYLSDGMTETLISSLSQLPNLSVKPRSSVFRYKGKETTPQAIGKELNVQAILNGRVVQRGQELSLFVELIDIARDQVVWSQQYNRKQSDLVTLQSEIARDVSSKLKSKLSGEDAAKVEKKYTNDPEAYQLYLKGRYQWNRRTGESLKQAVEFFDRAIEKDPNNALAYSGLAESYTLFPNYSVTPPADCMPKAKAAALRAIALDDSLAETRTALGIYYSNFAWNHTAAEKEFRRAIELNPNYASAHQQFGDVCLMALGRFDEAIAEGKRAEELDPLSPVISSDVGVTFTRARRLDEAIAQLNRALALDPNFYVTRYQLGTAYHAKGQFREAIAEYRKAMAVSDDPWAKALLTRSLVRSGQRDEAIKLLGELQSAAAHRFVPSEGFAIAYFAVGEKDKAFVWLEKAVTARSPRAALFSVNPVFDELRDDPRFAELVRRVEKSKLD